MKIMKVSFDKPFVGLDNKPLLEKGEPVIIGEKLGFLMFNLSSLNAQDIPQDRKFAIYRLMQKIQKGGEIEISEDERDIIKSVASDAFNVGAFGQIMEILGE